MSSNVAKMENQPSQPMQPMGESSALLSVIERAASNPEVDIDKMERLMAMHERTLERQAVAVYSEALSDMQDELPAVAERGNAAGRYTYAKWEDINTAIKPVLKKYGFALSFRTDCTDGITVTGVLSHKNGHSEQTTIKLPADGSGNKNAVQAVASSVSYGKRYTAGALLNLTSHGEDDDAYAAIQQMPEPVDVSAFLKDVKDSKTSGELEGVWKAAAKTLQQARDKNGYAEVKAAVLAKLESLKTPDESKQDEPA